MRKFSLLIGMPYSTFNDKFKGKRDFTFNECIKIKQFLNVDVPLEILFSEDIAS